MFWVCTCLLSWPQWLSQYHEPKAHRVWFSSIGSWIISPKTKGPTLRQRSCDNRHMITESTYHILLYPEVAQLIEYWNSLLKFELIRQPKGDLWRVEVLFFKRYCILVSRGGSRNGFSRHHCEGPEWGNCASWPHNSWPFWARGMSYWCGEDRSTRRSSTFSMNLKLWLIPDDLGLLTSVDYQVKKEFTTLARVIDQDHDKEIEA